MTFDGIRAVVPTACICSRHRARKLHRAVWRLVRKQPATVGWLHFLPEIAWEHRAHLLGYLIDADSIPYLTPPLRQAILATLQHYPAAQWESYEFPAIVAAIARGVRVDAIETWAWLRGVVGAYVHLRFCPGPEFEFPLRTAAILAGDRGWQPVQMIRLAWNLAGKSPHKARLLSDPSFQRLNFFAQEWLILYAGTKEAPDARPLCPLLESMPPDDCKALVSYEYEIQAGHIARLPLPAAVAIFTAWPKLRASERTGLSLATRLFPLLSPARCAEIAQSAPAVFNRIGKARRNRQMWYETREALEWAGPAWEELIHHGLVRRPDLLFEAAERLYTYGEVRTRRLLRHMRTHPLFQAPEGLIALDRLLCEHRHLAVTLPGFSTWDRHFAGEKVISVPAINDLAAQLREGLIGLQLRFLTTCVEADLALCGDTHAGLLRAGLRRGRRPMVRFLQQFTRGRDTRLDHPANQRWLACRPEFRLDLWLRPLRLTLPVPGLGEVTIGVEDNPFEILRLGTYARTCLAAGAGNSGNVVAVLLDVNKRAIFARNAEGRFLARQIVGVSDAGRLVCHTVYPQKLSTALEDLFELYVEDWAMQLRLPLGRSDDGDEALEIAPLTTNSWYDDGLWNRYQTPEVA